MCARVCVGMFGAGLFLVGLSFMDCTQTALAVILLIFAVTLSGTAYSGFLVNHMDIAPRFAGTLFGISNGLASVSGFIAPPVAAAITKDVSGLDGFIGVRSPGGAHLVWGESKRNYSKRFSVTANGKVYWESSWLLSE